MVRTTASGPILASGVVTGAKTGGVGVAGFGGVAGEGCCATEAAAKPKRANIGANSDNFMDSTIVPGPRCLVEGTQPPGVLAGRDRLRRRPEAGFLRSSPIWLLARPN